MVGNENFHDVSEQASVIWKGFLCVCVFAPLKCIYFIRLMLDLVLLTVYFC